MLERKWRKWRDRAKWTWLWLSCMVFVLQGISWWKRVLVWAEKGGWRWELERSLQCHYFDLVSGKRGRVPGLKAAVL